MVTGWCRLPGPAAFDFQMQGEAHERADQDDECQAGDPGQVAGDDYGTNNVTGNQEFQAENDGAAQVAAIIAEGIIARLAAVLL